jgi:putative transposase
MFLMSNPVHTLLEPAQPADLPRLMHWLNWYSASCSNRMLRRKEHFWERSSHGCGFARDDHVRALNTLRYIHGNPRAAGIQTSFFDRSNNDAKYARLSEDGLTRWHPTFLTLAETRDECSARYRNFCRQNRPEAKPKPRDTNGWGSQWLPQLPRRRGLQVPGNGASIPPGRGRGRPCLGRGPGPCWCGGPASINATQIASADFTTAYSHQDLSNPPRRPDAPQTLINAHILTGVTLGRGGLGRPQSSGRSRGFGFRGGLALLRNGLDHDRSSER